MPYTITPDQARSITDVEMAFSTDRLLPSIVDIPPEFFQGNLYTRVAGALFANAELPACTIEPKSGFDPVDINRAVRSHLQSFAPKHEHKVAGVAYMLACMATLHEG